MRDGELDIGEVAMFVGQNFVLSVRNNSQQGAGFVLYAPMDAVVDRYFPILDSLETDLEQIEARSSNAERPSRISSGSTA